MGISSFGYLIKEGVKNVWSNRIMSIASICVLMSCLILTGSAILLSMNVAQVVESVGDSNETTVYLNDDVSGVEAAYIGKDLQKLDNIASVEFYSKEEAFKEYEDVLGDEIFANLQGNDNPLPDAYHISMVDLSEYEQTVSEIMNINGVNSVSNRSDVAKQLTNISNLVSTLSFWIVLALTVISLFIISNTIRMTMYSRRFEISIMKSVGATNAFVRIPFIVEGMMIGLISSIISSVGLYFLYNLLMKIITDIIPFAAIPINNVIVYVSISFVIAGIVVGAIGAFISVRKYLKKEGNEILGW
ncbi:MAG: permease-like cell division protein FtsX [bacterium]|nr:permease-like cell division protein FtsX [bacterium]MDD6226078.1 permease-like cell division protein FtsX [bacterium]MDY3862298.1 permease-like cell division protein FtsX [Ruminococcus sp.]